ARGACQRRSRGATHAAGRLTTGEISRGSNTRGNRTRSSECERGAAVRLWSSTANPISVDHGGAGGDASSEWIGVALHERDVREDGGQRGQRHLAGRAWRLRLAIEDRHAPNSESEMWRGTRPTHRPNQAWPISWSASERTRI